MRSRDNNYFRRGYPLKTFAHSKILCPGCNHSFKRRMLILKTRRLRKHELDIKLNLEISYLLPSHISDCNSALMYMKHKPQWDEEE